MDIKPTHFTIFVHERPAIDSMLIGNCSGGANAIALQPGIEVPCEKVRTNQDFPMTPQQVLGDIPK